MEIKRLDRNKVRAFTLIELLVVMTIIVILMGLLFPAFHGVQDQARKVQAKNDLTQIVTAVNAYYTEYGKYPTSATTDVTFSTTNTDLFDVLRATQTGGSGSGANANDVLNPRKIAFVAPPDAKNPSRPQGGIATQTVTVNGISIPAGSFLDPWGTTYKVTMDGTYDNSLPNPYGSAGGAGSNPIRTGVTVRSFGNDATTGTNNDNIFKTAAGVQSDDVISWQ